MHIWGDSWFKKYGNQLYNAIDILEYRIRKWAKCRVYGKEKFGTYRDEYFSMWNGELSTIFFGYKFFHDRNWFEKLMWKIDIGLANFNRAIGLVKLVNKWQIKMLNKAVQITCKEYPDVNDELLIDVGFYKLIKPCKWGRVDGEKIHTKYWKSL